MTHKLVLMFDPKYREYLEYELPGSGTMQRALKIVKNNSKNINISDSADVTLTKFGFVRNEYTENLYTIVEYLKSNPVPGIVVPGITGIPGISIYSKVCEFIRKNA